MWVLCPFKTAKSRLVFNLIVQIYEKKMEHVIFLCQEDCWKGVEKSCFLHFSCFS